MVKKESVLSAEKDIIIKRGSQIIDQKAEEAALALQSKVTSFAKAHERKMSKKSLLGVEAEMARKYEQICSAMNVLLGKHRTSKIDADWSDLQWKRFSGLVGKRKIARKLGKKSWRC